jgi:hypothetical protein
MRSLLILLAGLCVSTATSLVLYTAVHWGNEPFVEVLEGGQLRTNVDEGALDAAIAQVLKANSLAESGPVERSGEADSYTPGVPWFAPPDLFGRSKKWTSRLSAKQLDQFGRPLQIEVLDDGDLQSLVVVHHNDRGAANRVAHHLALKLAERGVTSVN